MALEDTGSARLSNTGSTQLSTGTAVDLPLVVSFAMGGVVVPASHTELASVLPEALAPVRIAPRVGAVTLVGIQYHRVGTGSGGESHPEVDRASGDPGSTFEPYDEFAAIVPCRLRGRDGRPSETGGSTGDILERIPFLGSTEDYGGFVHWLPVTTEESVALGREVWGYPKERAEITVTNGPNAVRTVVDLGPGTTLRLEVPRPRFVPGRTRAVTLDSFTTMEGVVLRSRVDVRGRIAIGPALGAMVAGAVDATPLRSLGIWKRPLVAFTGSRVVARLQRGEPVAPCEWVGSTDVAP